jgi:hypothetical protein
MKWLLCLLASLCPAAEIMVRADALQRLVEQRMFATTNRKLWLKGNEKSGCNYAWLESPQVALQNGRFLLTARLSAKVAALPFPGACVGPMIRREILIVGNPFVQDGSLGVKDISMSELKDLDGAIADLVFRFARGRFPREFRYDILRDLRGSIARMGETEGLQLDLNQFQFSNVRVEDRAIVINCDFKMNLGARP